MSCHHPKPAYLSPEGKVTFTRREKALGSAAFIHIRCRMCRGCKADHAREWAIRCYHESQGHRDSCFVTFTYDPEHLPPHGTLNKSDLQLFWKKLRNRGHQFRYFACGEYGERKGRPHYHAVIFGYRPKQKILLERSEKGNPQYADQELKDCWPYGRITWSEFDPSCARYVAHYTADKLKSYAKDAIDPETGLRPYEVMDRDGVIWKLQPEFQAQSLKPALGKKWLEKNYREVFPVDTVVMDGKEFPPPSKYYEWLQEIDPDLYAQVREKRKAKATDQEYVTGMRQHQIAQAKSARLDRLKRPLHDRS